MTSSSARALCGAATVLVVQDVRRSVEHYRDVLGFHTEFTYGEPTFYAGVARDGVVIHLQAASETKRQPGQGGINIFVTDVDALYRELKSRRGAGARFRAPDAVVARRDRGPLSHARSASGTARSRGSRRLSAR